MKEIYLNLTHFCNMECTRCYLAKPMREDRTIMSLETLEKFLELEWMKVGTDEEISISWLGGEALAIPLEKLREFRALISRYLPNARNQLITNLYSLSDAHVEFIKETFWSVETTYASGMKMSLDGNEEKYQARFRRNLKKLNDAGILCHVNVELNDKTVEKGVQHIIDLCRYTGQKSWEFDISLQFDHAFKNGVGFNDYQYINSIPLTISYKEWSEFVIQFIRDHHDEMNELEMRVGFLSSCFSDDADPFFNTMKSDSYMTLTPSGDIFGAPVFSAVAPLSYGNIHTNTEDEILNHTVRLQHRAYEMIGRFSGEDCGQCEYFNECRGGFSCVPVTDGSGECIGMKSIRHYMKEYKKRFDRAESGTMYDPSPDMPLMHYDEECRKSL